MHGLIGFCVTCMVIAVVIAAYLLPTLIAGLRHAPDIAAVIVINFTLGWTVLGWWAALALALRKSQPAVVQMFSQVNAPAHPMWGSGVTAMPPDRWEAVDALVSAHATLDRPGHLGQGVGARQKS